MSRLCLAVFVIICVVVSDAQAKRPFAFGRHRSHQPSFGLSMGIGGGYASDRYAPSYGHADFGYPTAIPHYGYGYVYDPYRSGRFEAPDLLNDPFFQYQHRYDSHFPGRRQAPVVIREYGPSYHCHGSR